MFLWKVLSSSFEDQRPILLFYHFEDSDGVSVRQPGDERPAGERQESGEEVVGIISQNCAHDLTGDIQNSAVVECVTGVCVCVCSVGW